MSTEVTSKPENVSELADLIESLTVFDYVEDGDGYQRSADAMWQAALAAFNYAASKVGATGFQASWAALRFYGEAMHVNGPYKITQLEDALYPQYDLPASLAKFIEENRDWLREQAAEKLADIEDERFVHPDVKAHWQQLAADD